MKHVVFAHRKLSFGGGERVMVERVAALAPLNLRISVLFRKEPDRRDVEPELRQRNPHVGEVLHLPGAWGAGRWLLANPPDLLVVCNHKGVQRALPWLARFGHRFPTVVTLHEHYERHLGKYRGISPLVDKWIIDWAFESHVRNILGPQPCVEIHPLYPHLRVEPPSQAERSRAKEALGVPGDALLLGYCGQIDGRKDPLSTLRLAREIEAQLGRPVHVVLAGRMEQDLIPAVEAEAQRLGLGPRTRLLGPVPDLAAVFRALDAYLMTSRNEGFFPIALIEALQQGVPVVAPTVGGIGTVLQDGQGGFLIRKPDDRQSIAPALLTEAAQRIAPLLADPVAWDRQRVLAHAFAVDLTEGYDAAGRFREAVTSWL